jgi:HK97 family phage portal protein
VASMPIRTYRNPGKEEVFPAILDGGNTSMTYTQYALKNLIMVHLTIWGNAYVLKVRDKMDRIIDLKPINPQLVKLKLLDGDKIFEVERLTRDGRVDLTQPPQILTDWEIMHIPAMGFDGTMGLSPVAVAVRTLGTSIASDKLAARFYQNGSMLGGVIQVKAPLASQVQADEIRRRWLVKHSGVTNSGDVAVLDAETSFNPITIPPEQLQFLQSRAWQTREVARMFGIPPHLVGDVEKSTSWGTGIEQQNVGFVTYTIADWTNRIEQSYTREVINVNKQYCEFDLDRLMRGDMGERFAAYGNAIQWGWMTRNEVRLKENMAEMPGLSVALTPVTMISGNPPTAAQMQAAKAPAPAPAAKARDSDSDDDSDSSGSSDDNSDDDSSGSSSDTGSSTSNGK